MNIDPTDYPNLRIDGPISATLFKVDGASNMSPLLIVGPTGAGKSSFIEALTQDASLRISSNQLEGFTQTINTYHVKSITWSVLSGSLGLRLVDVPGFADTKISTTNIVTMLKKWLRASGFSNLGRILYFTPIHSVRLPGSHRELLRTFQALTGARSAGNITIVTSMWDNLWGDGAKKRAEINFNQLRDNVWKEFIYEGAQIVKFHNTQESALFVLNIAFRALAMANFHLEVQFSSENELRSAPFANHLMDDLQSRIQNLEVERATTDMDLKGASERGDEQLMSTLVPKLKEVETFLEKFKRELYDNFEVVATPSPFVDVLDEPFNPGNPIDITTAQPSNTAVPLATLSSSTLTAPQIDPPTDVSQVEHRGLDPGPPKRWLFAHVLRSVKCWGDAVAERHDT